MDQEKLLRSATGWQKRRKKETPRAGTSAKHYLQMKQRQLEKNAEVVDLWLDGGVGVAQQVDDLVDNYREKFRFDE